MKELRKGLVWLYGALGAVGLIATLVSALNNTVRDWFLTHAPAGWYGALGAATALCVSIGMLSASRANARRLQEAVNDLQVASHGAVPNAAQIEEEHQRRAMTHAADQRLLEELLDGWRPNDEIIHWLTADFFIGHAPIRLFDQVYNHAVLWQSEPREFASEQLTKAFAELREAVDQFADVGGNEWWLGTDEQRTEHQQWLYPRVRYVDGNPAEWNEVEALLFGARDRLVGALSEIYRVAHAEGIDLSKVAQTRVQLLNPNDTGLRVPTGAEAALGRRDPLRGRHF